MTIPISITLTCTKCESPLTAAVFSDLNADGADNLPMQIMSGELFDIHCPRCQGVSHLEYDCLYQDPRHGAVIRVIHKQGPDYAAKISQARSAQTPPGRILRIVHDLNGLKEKVACLEYGRDDRIIELCKMFTACELQAGHPDFHFSHGWYTVTGEKELLRFFDREGNERCCEFPDKTYHRFKALYENSPYAAQFDHNYPIVDDVWANKLLFPLMNAEIQSTPPATGEKAPGPQTAAEPETPVICPRCHSELPADSVFCQRCGTRLPSAAIAAPVPPPQEPPQPPAEEDPIQSQRDRCLRKRFTVTEAENRKKKLMKVILISAAALLVSAGILLCVMTGSHNGKLRNFATEPMKDAYSNVYADIISLEPAYFIYTAYGSRPYHLSEIVCRCVTVEGKTIWAAIDIEEYPGGSSVEADNEPQHYGKSNPMRIFGYVSTAGHVMDELKGKIGDILILDVNKKIQK